MHQIYNSESQLCQNLQFQTFFELKILALSIIVDNPSNFITTQRYTQIVTGRYARCVYLVFVFTMIIHKIATLAEIGKMEGNIVSRVRKSVPILAAKYKYKHYNLFFARLVSRICFIYVLVFRTQCSSISHIIRN